MSEKGQGKRASGPPGAAAGAGNGGSIPEAPASKPPETTDTGGQRPADTGGRGGGGAPPRPQQPMTGEFEFEDGSNLSRDERGNVRYRDPQGRSGLWRGGDTWVDEATGQPMPSDFRPKTPGDRVPWLR